MLHYEQRIDMFYVSGGYVMTIDPQREDLRRGRPMSEEEYHSLNCNIPFTRYEYIDGAARLMSGGSGELCLL